MRAENGTVHMYGTVLTFLRHAEGDHDERVEGNPQDGIHAGAHAVLDELALQRAHGRIVDAAAGLEDAEAPEDDALLAHMCRQEEAQRRGSKGVYKDLLGR